MNENNFVVAFPTDTVYGLGTTLYNKKGLERIYELKKRPLEAKIGVLVSDIKSASNICYVTNIARRLFDKFKGDITIVLNARKKYKDFYLEENVGIRIPVNNIALDIIKKYGPLKTTSVNIHGKPNLNSYNDVYNEFKDSIDLIYAEDGSISKSIPSTVIILKNNKVNIIREGIIKEKEIEDFLNLK
ncbi:MAG: threonylcarbamoyl-AMP synthase [Acholeplasmatales bacterium]|jgi:L-threonylcarbamoyladenylate synthase|nr:threonylcarbamoyl-AMP synthase [Acholeplasmatales bacterium]